MEDDIDIYEDLPSFETKDSPANKELTEECLKLREENTKLKEDIDKLGANMSSLMKTAKAEIARKDKMIAQLRQELDNAAFRRGNYGVRKKQNINNPKFQKFDQSTEKTQQTPLVKQEALQENAVTELDDILDMEDMGGVEHPAPTDYQDKLTSTVFGARLKNKLLLEQEAERIKKEEARIASLAIPVKLEKVGDTELGSTNGFVKKEDTKDAFQDTSNAPTQKMEVPVESSLPHSTARISQLYQEDDNPSHRRASKRNLSEKPDFSANSEQPKRRRVEEERYRREEDARQHHNGNFKYDDVRYNSDGFENNDYSKPSTKYTDLRRVAHSRDDYDRAHHTVRDGRSNSTYRSNGVDPRYNERRSDRHMMEESRPRYDKYENRREEGWSKEGDNKWSEYSRQIDEFRNKIEGKADGRSEYNNYDSHHQSGWNLKRLGCKSRSPEKYRSHSGSRGSREKEFDKRRSKRSGSSDKYSSEYRSHSSSRGSREEEFDKRRSKRSRSSDKYVNNKSTVDERESGKERHSTRVKNSKDFEVEVGNSRDAEPKVPTDSSRNDPPNKTTINKISKETAENGLHRCTERSSHADIENAESAKVTLEKLGSQVETPNGRFAALENGSEVASIQSATPESAALGSGSFRDEKRRKDEWNGEGRNWFEYSREIYELRDNIENKVGGMSEHNNYNSHHQSDSNLKRLGCKSRSPEKYKNHSDSRKSRDKELDKRRSKRSKSSDKYIKAKSTVDERKSVQERAKNSKDIEVEVKNSHDTLQEVLPDCSRNDPANKVRSDKISSSEIAENGSDHVGIENAESAKVAQEKHGSQVETPNGRIAALENDSEVASVQPAMSEAAAAVESGSSREEKRREGDNNCIKYSKENDKLRDKFESNVGGSSESNNYNSLKRLGHKSRSPEKSQSRSDSRRSREKEFDKRSKKTSSTDKFINAKSTVDERGSGKKQQSTVDERESGKKQHSTVDERESGKKQQSTRTKDSKDIEVEVKNSRDAQPEVPSDFSRNDPPKELPIDNISSSEIAEKESAHVDIENAESARITPEKLDRIAALKNDSEVAPIQSTEPEGEEKRREGDNNCIESSREIDKLRDKFESNAGDKSECNNHNSRHQSERSLKRLGSKSRSPEKDKSHSGSRGSRENEFDKRRSKRSTRSASTDKCIKAKSTVDGRESGKERQSSRAQDSKDLEAELGKSRDAQPEVPSDFSKNSPPNEVAIDEISSSEIAKNGLIPCPEEPSHDDLENAESARVTLEKIVSQVETPDRWIAELENDSEVALTQSAVPETAAPGSGSFREEKIENIEKFIKDYQENEEPCLTIANGESEEGEKLGDSTSSIVDTLSMDVEESAADEKSDDVPKNPPVESRTDIKDVAGDTENKIPKADVPAAECTSSVQLKTLEDKKISVTPETSDKKADTQKHLTDKVAVLKLTKYRPRLPCAPILSKFSRRKQSVFSDSASKICTVKSQSSANTEGDNKSKKEIKTRRVPTEETGVQSTESSTKKSDSKIVIPKKQIEVANILTDKNSNEVPPEAKNMTDDSRAREEADRIENSENNSVSVLSSGNILHQAKTSPVLPAKADAAPKLNNVQEPVELRETCLAQKSTPATVPSTDSKLSNRKKALPKEVDSRAKSVAKQYNIIVTARRRRPVELKDSCTAETLIPSVHDVNENESVKTVCAKAEIPELPKLVSEPAIRGRKRRLIDK